MAKDDYFVIVYRLLIYLYGCLKKGKPVDMNILCSEYFSINSGYWDYIIRNLHQDGYITGVFVAPIPAAPEGVVSIQPDINITPSGIQYLSENSMFQKIKDAAKDIAAIIPV